MSNLYISETHVNRTNNYVFSESPAYETFTDNLGVLFNHLMKEHGRCISSMYIDHSDRVKTQRIGWVFECIDRYEDSKETFKRETWITVLIMNEESGKLELIDMGLITKKG